MLRSDSAKRRLRALALIKEGWKKIDVAVELGVTPSAVSHWLARVNHKRDKALVKQKPKSDTVKLIIQLLQERKWTQRQLAEEMGVNERTVRYWIADVQHPTGPAKRLLERLVEES